MKFFREFRILPLVLAGVIGLGTLKTLGIVLDGGYLFSDRDVPAVKPASWAQQMFNFPSRGNSGAGDVTDITGSVEEKKEAKPEAKSETKAEVKGKPETTAEGKPAEKAPDAKPVPGRVDLTAVNQPGGAVSASERAILERLAERRQELDARAREIDIRENLLKAAEKRIESKVADMKATEARITTANDQKGQVEADRYKGLVTMYESMKPKDAAKIFDRLEMSVLIQVASKIAPRKLSDIVGLMSPEAAERLTVELARRASGDQAVASSLPKIEGRPTVEDSN